ncbi:MAG: carboxypeptidase-like regulatory domain-containing protein [Planctomycetota bacterium]
MLSRRLTGLLLCLVAAGVVLAASFQWRGAVVRGSVVDAGGNPLAGRTVVLLRPGRKERTRRFQISGPGGRYEFREVPHGEWVLGVEAVEADRAIQSEGLLGEVALSLARTQEVAQDLRAVPRLTLQGRVEPDHPGPGWEVGGLDANGVPQFQVQADGRGAFEVGTAHRGPLWAGAFRAREEEPRHWVEEHARTPAPVEVAPGAVLVLEGAPTLLLLEAPAGLPAGRGLTWDLEPRGERPSDFWWRLFHKRKRAAGGTLQHGETREIRGLLPGPYTLRLTWSGRSTTVDLEIPPSRTLAPSLALLFGRLQPETGKNKK